MDMHTRDYAAAALAELIEELERLTLLSASPDRLGAVYAHSSRAMRALVSVDSGPWLGEALARIRETYGLGEVSLLQTGIESVSELLDELTPDALSDSAGEAAPTP